MYILRLIPSKIQRGKYKIYYSYTDLKYPDFSYYIYFQVIERKEKENIPLSTEYYTKTLT